MTLIGLERTDEEEAQEELLVQHPPVTQAETTAERRQRAGQKKNTFTLDWKNCIDGKLVLVPAEYKFPNLTFGSSSALGIAVTDQGMCPLIECCDRQM
mmetsp:Transcript_36019/g.87033  ORF Transcript_36019/g.87033 Transcript_36019/m.87033 type:complete len:98 (-) Transcript_36019:869-1162(-)